MYNYVRKQIPLDWKVMCRQNSIILIGNIMIELRDNLIFSRADVVHILALGSADS